MILPSGPFLREVSYGRCQLPKSIRYKSALLGLEKVQHSASKLVRVLNGRKVADTGKDGDTAAGDGPVQNARDGYPD